MSFDSSSSSSVSRIPTRVPPHPMPLMPATTTTTNSTTNNSTPNCLDVYCRVRPNLPVTPLGSPSASASATVGSLTTDDNSVTIAQRKDTYVLKFPFASVFGGESSQRSVYQSVASPIVDQLMQGRNGSIICYGCTGTGKTFTVEGKSGLGGRREDRGLVPRTIEDVISRVENIQQTIIGQETPSPDALVSIEVAVSMYEIYMGRIQDLLKSAPSSGPTSAQQAFVPQRVLIQEDKNQKLILVGLSSTRVTNVADALTLFRQGAARRIVAPTAANADSSRSHSVFELGIRQVYSNGRSVNSRIRLIDLAGSEQSEQTGSGSAQRLLEAREINQSLLQLSTVIQHLSQKQAYVSFRDSVLTRVLQDSLSVYGSRTGLIITVSSAERDLKKSLNSLRLGSVAQCITLRRSPTHDDSERVHRALMELVSEQKKRIEQLSDQLQDAKEEKEPGGVKPSPRVGPCMACEAMAAENAQLKHTIRSLESAATDQQLVHAATVMREVEWERTIDSLKAKLAEAEASSADLRNQLEFSSSAIASHNTNLAANARHAIELQEQFDLLLRSQERDHQEALLAAQCKVNMQFSEERASFDVAVAALMHEKTQLASQLDEASRVADQKLADLRDQLARAESKVTNTEQQVQELRLQVINYSSTHLSSTSTSISSSTSIVECAHHSELTIQINTLRDQLAESARREQEMMERMVAAESLAKEVQSADKDDKSVPSFPSVVKDKSIESYKRKIQEWKNTVAKYKEWHDRVVAAMEAKHRTQLEELKQEYKGWATKVEAKLNKSHQAQVAELKVRHKEEVQRYQSQLQAIAAPLKSIRHATEPELLTVQVVPANAMVIATGDDATTTLATRTGHDGALVPFPAPLTHGTTKEHIANLFKQVGALRSQVTSNQLRLPSKSVPLLNEGSTCAPDPIVSPLMQRTSSSSHSTATISSDPDTAASVLSLNTVTQSVCTTASIGPAQTGEATNKLLETLSQQYTASSLSSSKSFEEFLSEVSGQISTYHSTIHQLSAQVEHLQAKDAASNAERDELNNRLAARDSELADLHRLIDLLMSHLRMLERDFKLEVPASMHLDDAHTRTDEDPCQIFATVHHYLVQLCAQQSTLAHALARSEAANRQLQAQLQSELNLTDRWRAELRAQQQMQVEIEKLRCDVLDYRRNLGAALAAVPNTGSRDEKTNHAQHQDLTPHIALKYDHAHELHTPSPPTNTSIPSATSAFSKRTRTLAKSNTSTFKLAAQTHQSPSNRCENTVRTH